MTQALDKGALGPVSIMGWQEDVGAKGQDFAMTSTVMWIGIIAGEPLVSVSVFRGQTLMYRQINLLGDFQPPRSCRYQCSSGQL